MKGCGCPVCKSHDGKIDLDTVDESARTVRAACVAAWIDAKKGLELRGGRVVGPLCLDYFDVGLQVIVHSRLDGISAKNTTFKNVVDLSDSRISGDMDFVGAVFERVLLLDRVHVAGKISLWATRLKSGLSAKQLIVHGEFDAREMDVVASAAFDDAKFKGTVTFRRAHVAQTLGLQDARCHGIAKFNGAVIADIDLTGTRFCSEVSLSGVHVAETLRLNGARLAGAVSFDECDVRDLELGNAGLNPPVDGPRIAGDVSFGGGTIHTLMTIENARFAGNVTFEGLHVGGWRWNAVTFGKSLTLRDVHVERSVAFTDCTMVDFTAANFEVAGMAEFQKLHCTGAVKMTGATFCSDLLFRNVACKQIDLSGTNVAGRLRLLDDGADGALVGATDLTSEALKLENVTVAQDVTLCLRVHGVVQVRGLSVTGSLSLNGLRVTPSAAQHDALLAARFLTVGRDFTFSWKTDDEEPAPVTHIAGNVDLTGAKVAGTLRFRRDALPAQIALGSATLGTLAFDDSAPPPEVDIDLKGCTYGGFTGNWEWLIKSFHETAAPVRPRTPAATKVPDFGQFLQLEKALRNAGNDADADAAFYAGRERTRSETSLVQWWPQKAFTGYGVKAWRLGTWILALWLVAATYFAVTSGAVHQLSVRSRTNPTTHAVMSLDDSKNSCGTDRASLMQATLLALELFVPTNFPDRDVVVAPSCDVRWGGMPLPSWVTSAVVLVLKLGGLILIPLAVVIVSGVLRPSAKA